jgi:hypothetical protein
MRTLILYGIMLLSSFGCKAQDNITASYIWYQYQETKNNSFIRRELLFLEKRDTLRINIRMPFNTQKPQIVSPGIFYNCHLKENTVYTITLKKICVSEIPEAFTSYYKTNTIPDRKDCSQFTEIEENTEYKYTGNYGKYVDIDGTLYEIIGLSPSDGCVFQH